MDSPVHSPVSPARRTGFFSRLKPGAPLFITIIVHVVLGLVAGVIIVQQNAVAKTKTFEASSASAEPALKQVEHRLQVARRGGAAGAAQSPVSASRIFSTASNSLQMPAPPELPSMGSSSLGGFGGMGGGVGTGQGAGLSTGLGGASLGSAGFMSMSFLGTTSQSSSRVVFVVDTSAELMDLRKGGFRAFTIIREEIMRLVSRLPPAAQFNVILFSGGAESLNLFAPELVPATAQNKQDFFDWLKPVNTDYTRLGSQTAARQTRWTARTLPDSSGINPLFLPPHWSHGVRAALEQQPDTMFVITSSTGVVYRRASDETIAQRRAAVEKRRAELERQGIDIRAIETARARSMDIARREFEDANRRLVAAGKDPIIITDPIQIFSAPVQAALRRIGVTIVRDLTGWTDKQGKPIDIGGLGMSDVTGADWDEFYTYLSLLQRQLVPKRTAIHTFLFVGPDENPEHPISILTTVAKRNSGKFQLLTTKRLEQLVAQDTKS